MRWKCLSYFSVQALEESSVRKINEEVRAVYISPYCWQASVPPSFMKFGGRDHVTSVITCVKFLVNRFRGYGVMTPKIDISH